MALPLAVPLIMAGSSLLSGILGSQSADKQAQAQRSAARAQADASRYGMDLAQGRFDQVRSDLQPFLRAGQGATTGLHDVGLAGQYDTSFDPYQQYQTNSSVPEYTPFGVDPMSVYQQTTQPFEFNPEDDPSYQFRLQQGIDAIEGSAAARGGLFSGQTGKDLMEYGQGLASDSYKDAFSRDLATKGQVGQAYGLAAGQNIADQRENLARRQMGQSEYYNALTADSARRQDAFNRTMGLAGMGQNAAAQVGQQGTATTGIQSQLASDAARAYGQGQIGSAQAYGQASQNWGNQFAGLGSGMSNYLMLDQLYGRA